MGRIVERACAATFLAAVLVASAATGMAGAQTRDGPAPSERGEPDHDGRFTIADNTGIQCCCIPCPIGYEVVHGDVRFLAESIVMTGETPAPPCEMPEPEPNVVRRQNVSVVEGRYWRAGDVVTVEARCVTPWR